VAGQGLPLWNPGFDGEHSFAVALSLLPHTKGRGRSQDGGVGGH